MWCRPAAVQKLQAVSWSTNEYGERLVGIYVDKRKIPNPGGMLFIDDKAFNIISIEKKDKKPRMYSDEIFIWAAVELIE